jgi:hypothetical protein
MNSHLSPRALFWGSAASGLVAGAIGPLVLFLGTIVTSGFSGWRTAELPSAEGLGIVLVIVVIFGGIGVLAALCVGFPVLMSLRAAGRLNSFTAPIAGAFVGLGAALAFWLLDSFKLGIFPMAGLIGAICGSVALRVANKIAMRPNALMERSREP